mmetsp:Transcript_43130/g.119297  ORF Transcript_43130/g.119297 Transcript_43130/m.119297 type:complete len:496 (+) Transcript_43130:152-1639(+)
MPEGLVDRLPELWRKAGVEGPRQRDRVLRFADIEAWKDAKFKDVFVDDALAASLVSEALEGTSRFCKRLRESHKVALPKKVSRFNECISKEESRCLHLMTQADASIQQLQGDVGVIEEEGDWLRPAVVSRPVTQRLRLTLALRLMKELRTASDDMLAARVAHNEELKTALRRQLSYAFPEAQPAHLDLVMTSVVVAEHCIERRICEDTDCPRLVDVVAEFEGSARGMRQRLEAEAADLEMLFYHFHNLAGQNDGQLSEIEQNIESTLLETQEAVAYLKEAKALKFGNQLRRIAAAGVVLLILCLVWWNYGPEVTPFLSLPTWIGVSSGNFSETETKGVAVNATVNVGGTRGAAADNAPTAQVVEATAAAPGEHTTFLQNRVSPPSLPARPIEFAVTAAVPGIAPRRRIPLTDDAGLGAMASRKHVLLTPSPTMPMQEELPVDDRAKSVRTTPRRRLLRSSLGFLHASLMAEHVTAEKAARIGAGRLPTTDDDIAH